ncbi:MAG TPA: sodium/solute symporter [Bryobacteraceae bacterium]|nr:sodium/solute symporter [Bryobacteraceae bacterium]
MTPLDYAVLALYFVSVAVIGSWAGRGQNSGIAYFLADRSLHWLPAGITMIAVSVSAITFIGMPGQSYKSDWRFLQLYFMIPAAALLTCRIFLPLYTRMRVETAYEFLERRFDLRTRLLASGLFLIIIAGTAGVVLYAPAIVLSEMTGLPVVPSILLIGAVTAIYTMLGGVRGVIYTDILQAAVFMSGWLASVWCILRGLPGGASQAWSTATGNGKLRLIDTAFDWNAPATLWSGTIAMLFTHLALMAVNQKQVQKYLAASGEQNGRRAILFQGAGLLGVYIAFFSLGTLLWVFYRVHAESLPPGLAPDRVFPYFIMHELPRGLRGFVIAGAFAAAMSTMSATLNSLANVTVIDFWDRARPGNTVRRAKLATALWGVAAVGAGVLAWRLGSILESIVKINSYFYGSLLGVFLLGALTRSATAAGASAGLLISVLAVLGCARSQPGMWVWFGAIGCVVSFAAGYLASMVNFHELRYRSSQRARY